mmetsp:Transcript_10017/g.18261  ORF Transcript_10017/g.18261 Transcript_10017/m.18261 type:complete len:204 (-) Transcript_10017:131-742(-)
MFIGLFPSLGISNIPKNVMVFYHGSTNVANHHDNLIGHVSPPPNAFVVRIVGFDKWMVGNALIFKIPFIFGGPSSQRLHLYENHALVPTREASDNGLVKIDRFGNVVRGRLPLAVAIAEIEAEATLIGGIQRWWDVDLLGGVVIGFAAEVFVEERRFNFELYQSKYSQRQDEEGPGERQRTVCRELALLTFLILTPSTTRGRR